MGHHYVFLGDGVHASEALSKLDWGYTHFYLAVTREL